MQLEEMMKKMGNMGGAGGANPMAGMPDVSNFKIYYKL